MAGFEVLNNLTQKIWVVTITDKNCEKFYVVTNERGQVRGFTTSSEAMEEIDRFEKFFGATHFDQSRLWSFWTIAKIAPTTALALEKMIQGPSYKLFKLQSALGTAWGLPLNEEGRLRLRTGETVIHYSTNKTSYRTYP